MGTGLRRRCVMTGDMREVIRLLKRYIQHTGKPFQFVLGDIHQRIYDDTGKVDDPDIHEVGNDEYIDTLRKLIEEHTND
jgi:hypothetical protein